MIKGLSQFESETITEKAISIPFAFENRESIPEGKEPGDCIVIRPITVRTWFRIRPLILQIEKEDLGRIIVSKDEVNVDLADLMAKYDELIIDIICIGIHNKKSDPPQWFRDVLVDNTTWDDLRILLNAIIYRIGFFPFCESITMLQNVSPLKTETEIIAAHKNLTSWQESARQDS
jgi:hypothetical protein